MKREIKPKPWPEPKTVRAFAHFPKTIYYQGKRYRVWLEFYGQYLVWHDGGDGWGKGYRIEREWPIFKTEKKKMKKIKQIFKRLFSRKPVCTHEHKTEISRSHAGYLIAYDSFPQFVSHVEWKCEACGEKITYVGTEIV